MDGWTEEQSETNLPLQLLQSWGITMHYRCTSYASHVPDKLNLCPFYHLTFKCDLYLQPTNLHFFFTKTPKKIIFFLGGGGGVGRGEGGGVDGWTDEQAQTNLPLQLLRSWGYNNAFMYKLCP